MKNKIGLSIVEKADKKVQDLAANVARFESEIVLSERKLAQAERDDGITDPGEIYQRVETARRELAILKIQANREAAKLVEAESELDKLILEYATPLAKHLEEKANDAANELREKVSPLIGEVASSSMDFARVINLSPSVTEPRSAAHRIRLAAEMSHNKQRPGRDLLVNILDAAHLC